MIYHIIAVYDNRTGAYMTPVSVVSVPQAIRSFLKETAEGGEFFSIRADLELRRLGGFEEQDGSFVPIASGDMPGVLVGAQ